MMWRKEVQETGECPVCRNKIDLKTKEGCHHYEDDEMYTGEYYLCDKCRTWVARIW